MARVAAPIHFFDIMIGLCKHVVTWKMEFSLHEHVPWGCSVFYKSFQNVWNKNAKALKLDINTRYNTKTTYAHQMKALEEREVETSLEVLAQTHFIVLRKQS